MSLWCENTSLRKICEKGLGVFVVLFVSLMRGNTMTVSYNSYYNVQQEREALTEENLYHCLR